MPVNVSLDKIETLSMDEKYGVVIGMERVAHVSGLTNVNKDYRTLKEALDAAGVPAYGSSPAGLYNIAVTERKVTMLDIDRAEVTLVYEPVINDGQSYDDPPIHAGSSGLFIGEMKANISQVTTNKDENGDLITVQYTYPSDDPDYPGETNDQGGEISYYQVQRTKTYVGVKEIEEPWTISDAVVGFVNSVGIWGDDERTWLCTGCSWKLLDATPGKNRYHMTFEFQFNPDTWDPTAVYIDERTGKPPPDLEEDVGYKTIPKMEGCDFLSIIGVELQ